MITCKKSYRDIPFAHRQHRHEGHCALIHGHNWTITLTFACEDLDANGFVIDFGKLSDIKQWIADHLDHACLFNQDDSEKDKLLQDYAELFHAYILPSCSCEGIAEHLHGVFDAIVREGTEGRCRIVAVEIEEDSKNSAEYRID
ncbi:MAG: 6-carboxytetrahydropterin synthase [Verrucomicrobiota bacterium]